jgi:hypothetical protein
MSNRRQFFAAIAAALFGRKALAKLPAKPDLTGWSVVIETGPCCYAGKELAFHRDAFALRWPKIEYTCRIVGD